MERVNIVKIVLACILALIGIAVVVMGLKANKSRSNQVDDVSQYSGAHTIIHNGDGISGLEHHGGLSMYPGEFGTTSSSAFANPYRRKNTRSSHQSIGTYRVTSDD